MTRSPRAELTGYGPGIQTVLWLLKDILTRPL